MWPSIKIRSEFPYPLKALNRWQKVSDRKKTRHVIVHRHPLEIPVYQLETSVIMGYN